MYANGDASKIAQDWATFQQKMWSDWLQMMQTSPALGAEQWQKLAQQSMQTWLEQAEPTAKRAAEQMISGQQAAFTFLQTAAAAWSEIATQLADGDEWRSVLDDYARRLRGEIHAGAGQWATAAEQMAQAPQWWQTYMQPWSQFWEQTATQWQQPGTAPSFGMMGDIVSRTFDVYQQTFGRFVETPPLGYSREYEEKSRQMTKALQEYAVANAEYQAAMGDAWVNGLNKLMDALIARAKAGNPIRSFQELSNEWASIADPAFYEVFVGEKYVRAQGKLLSATMNYRIAQRQFVEIMAKALDMPTRTEVDAAHKSIYEQRREVRELKRALADANAKIAALQSTVVDMRNASPAVDTEAVPSTATQTAKTATRKRTASATSTSTTTKSRASKGASTKKPSSRKRQAKGTTESTTTQKGEE